MLHRQLSCALALMGAFMVAALGTVARAADTVPIQGTVTGTVTVTPLEGSDSLYRLDNVGYGTCSHLGRIEATWAVPEVALDLGERTITVADLEWGGTIYAANGDAIFGRYRFPSDTIPFSITGDIVFEADLEVTGGTGRFAGASGHARTAGRANVFTRSFAIELVGEMSRVGANKTR